MIQRIQSIYLFLAAMATFGLFAVPLASTAAPVAESPIFNDSVFSIKEYLGIAPLIGAAGLLSLIAIFLYSNRMMQKVMVFFSAMLTVIACILSYFIFNSDNWAKTHIGELSGLYALTFPILAVILFVLSIMSINKDEKIVKSMDRLR
jgi:hypothetical protein